MKRLSLVEAQRVENRTMCSLTLLLPSGTARWAGAGLRQHLYLTVWVFSVPLFVLRPDGELHFLISCLLWIYEWLLQNGPWQDGCVYRNEAQFKEVKAEQSKDFSSRGSWVLGQTECFSEPGSCAGSWMLSCEWVSVQVLEAVDHNSVFKV